MIDRSNLQAASPIVDSSTADEEETQTAEFDPGGDVGHGLVDVPPSDAESNAPSEVEARAPGDESTEGESGDEEEREDVIRWTTTDATTYLYGLKVRHNISDTAFAAMYNGFRKVLPVLRHNSHLPSAKTVKRTVLKDIPTMQVDVAYMNKDTKELVQHCGLESVPKKRYEDRSTFEPVYEIWRTKLEDAVTYHYSMHAREEKEIVLNIDGVPLGRTGKSQTIVSLKFVSCRNVYQLTNAIPLTPQGKKHLTVKCLLGDVLQSVKDLNMDLKYFCADAPMRSTLRNQKSHTAKMGCDYCYGTAGHKGRPIWGLDTLNSKKRTMESLLRDYEMVQAKEKTFADFGYKGRSEILDILPDFDIVDQVPVDPLHLLYLGVARALFELLFAVGENRPTNLNHGPHSTRGLDDVIADIKVPSEIPRRPRAMDFKNWKGSEWRNLVLFYFPLVAEILRPGICRELWLEYCFLCRAYSVPDAYFDSLDKDKLKSMARNWYTRYFSAFGSLNMRYNVHLLAHLERIRVHGAFPDISAFTFESSFSAGIRAQHIGTSSIGLQFMRHSFLRPLKGHVCEKSISYTTKTTARRRDNLVYSERSCYVIVEDSNTNSHFLKVKKLNVSVYFPPGVTHLDFTTVGVFTFVSESDNLQYLRRDKVLGKLILVPVGDIDVLVTISNSQLREAD